MIDRTRIGFVLALTTLATGCDDEAKPPSVAERECKKVCAKFEMCNDETDVAGCESSCAGEAFRSDAYFETKSSCANTLACNRLVDGDGTDQCAGSVDCPLEDCVGDELSATPSEENEEACDRVGDKVAACSDLDSDVGQDQCLENSVLLSDAYLEASVECFNEVECAAVGTCLDDLADSYDTNVRLYTGDLE